MCPAVRVPDLPDQVWKDRRILFVCHEYTLNLPSIINGSETRNEDLYTQVAVLIVGAGPTGLGAASRLHQHGLKDWLIIDKVSPYPAGLLGQNHMILAAHMHHRWQGKYSQ